MEPTSGYMYSLNMSGGDTLGEDLGDMLGIGSARRERAYNEYMSNTAYQRAVADMKNAGLSPALMFGTGGQPASGGVHTAAPQGSAGGLVKDLVKLGAKIVMSAYGVAPKI